MGHKLYLIAGEASGDLHGSNLMKGLYALEPGIRLRFRGGDRMKAVYDGCADARPEDGLARDYRKGAVMGITDVLRKAGQLREDLEACKRDLLEWKPDAVVLIDYPGFNLKIARFAHEKGIKVFYYIAPKVWASREGRVEQLRRYVDRLCIVFPFEKAYFTRQGIPFVYAGNPLIDAVDEAPAMRVPRPDFLAAHGLPGKPYIAILAGSRGAEIARMMPVCMQVADRMREMNFVVAVAPGHGPEDYRSYLSAGTPDGKARNNVFLVENDTYGVLRHAQAAIINSGTASLEAALIGTPQVVAWSSSRLTYWVGLHVFRVFDHVKYISLANLILDKEVFKELIQDDFCPENVTRELSALTLRDSPERARMQADYAAIASRAVADTMLKSL